MRGDVVFRVYGVHEGRAEDSFFGAFRTRAEADSQITKLASREMQGENWAAKYHDKGFIVREHVIDTNFEIPSRPKPRDKFFVEVTKKTNAAGEWPSSIVDVFARRPGSAPLRVCGYERNHAMYQTFEPFRQGGRELALVSREYTKTAVLDLATGDIIAEETKDSPGAGFCPVGFYVPDWWDVNDGSIIPGSEYWTADKEWPASDFGFVWGCTWGDDSSWKLQYLDLRRVQEGVLSRDDRFGYVELATGDYVTPCLQRDSGDAGSLAPDFLQISKTKGVARVKIETYATFDLATGLRARGMRDFPALVKNPKNRIALSSQLTEGIEGYVFDGADGSQIALWTVKEDRTSTEHTHPFDEYVVVIEGRATVFMGEKCIELRAGDEYVIPRGTAQRMAVGAGTRTMHVFGGKRAERER